MAQLTTPGVTLMQTSQHSPAEHIERHTSNSTTPARGYPSSLALLPFTDSAPLVDARDVNVTEVPRRRAAEY